MRNFFNRIRWSQRSTPKESPANPSPHNVALHTIYTDVNPTLSIIAIHGHGGHCTTSWTHSSGVFWLKDMLPKVFAERHISIRVSTFGYSKEDEHDLGVEETAAFLAREATKLDGNGVLWIAHSFGGPLLKGVLGTSQGLVESTKGVLFFGVPRDVCLGSWGNMAVATAGNEAGTSDEMRRLQNEVRWLGGTEKAFTVLCEEGKLAPRWFVEASGGPEDASRGESERDDTIYLSKLHGEMVRFESSSDEDWRRVEQILVDMAEIVIEQMVTK